METRKRFLSADNDVTVVTEGFKVVQKKGKKSKPEVPTSNLSQPTPSIPTKNCTTTRPLKTSSDVIEKVCLTTHCDKLESCVYCDKMCELINSIQCKTCLHFHHLTCFGVDPTTFPSAFAVGNLLGWECEACRLEATELIRNLRSELNLVMSTLDAIKTKLRLSGTPPDLSTLSIATTSMQPKSGGSLDCSAPVSSAPTPAPVSVPSSDTVTRASIASVVIGTLRDVDRRKKNVVITGLPEPYRVADDIKTVTDLLVTQVQCPCLGEILSCTRLGKSVSTTRPRKLLVRFGSEMDAITVLNYAKTLRISTNRTIADNVYINADLSKDESKMAFDKREARRNSVRGRREGVERGDGGQANGTGAATNCSSNLSELRVSAEAFKPNSPKNTEVSAVAPLDSHMDTSPPVDSAPDANITAAMNLPETLTSL